MSFRAPIRPILRALPRHSTPIRFASANAYKNQKTSGVVWSSFALAGLFGWTAIIASVGRPTPKEHKLIEHVKEKVGEVKEAVVPASESSTTSTDSPKGSAPEGQSAAYDPETGEINWDCPCLGGMADGPCGEEFKAAFACFVYSEAEPKGVDCVEKFRGMQDCFRKHPDVYGNDDEDEDDDAELLSQVEAALKEEDKFTSSS